MEVEGEEGGRVCFQGSEFSWAGCVIDVVMLNDW